ncbi:MULTISPECIES: AtzE family amidohydrolase [unclassified Achromobacter]|uniref:AtzE family amidohydrolase n=1 Tax=unclassified Achromobacter TaxID=2626865 RepID=UPI000B51AADA|nr:MULTISPECIES: AtzE family amidohydrolase [unclassified Achromobacter]OWT69156.1 Asp-tRNA(Asn)/Glu-tRNA(Gln) amidotransferase GatCAB subunit A [Achromobacter sp. HZ34]OWT70561.1 Asp-tRNA(Asn)/Glu-tRNA(Gln) amidotransferase GatCAB subunit A [Achromobacter sp. HZ28]
MTAPRYSATVMARQIREGETSAVDLVAATLADIAARNPDLNAYTAITADRALAEAEQIDARRARGEHLPPLAGVPYAAKNLFDVQGLTTLCGGRVHADEPAATHDATAVARLRAAGAILTGTLNMDEHAYGFTTENSHYGTTRNPHDAARVAGGSSGGSGAAVGARLVPLALGTDTNGSVRVPAALCGVFGIKPTYGRLGRGGVFPFVFSLDHVGVLAASTEDLALACDAMQGLDARDPATRFAAAGSSSSSSLSGSSSGSSSRSSGGLGPLAPLTALPGGLRVAVLDGWFERWAGPDASRAVDIVAAALDARARASLHGAERARSAAFVITGAEGGTLHRHGLRTRYDAYEPHSRDRLLAGSLLPASWVADAQRARRDVYDEAMRLFERYDLLLAAATPVAAPPAGAATFDLHGQALPARASLGLLTQPLSCLGLPVCTVPVWPGGPGSLPLGVQIIAAPGRDDLCLAASAYLEQTGAARLAPAASSPR